MSSMCFWVIRTQDDPQPDLFRLPSAPRPFHPSTGADSHSGIRRVVWRWYLSRPTQGFQMEVWDSLSPKAAGGGEKIDDEEPGL